MATSKKALTRDALLKAARPREWVDLPELDGGVWVQGLTAQERDIYQAQIMQQDRKTGRMIAHLSNSSAKLVAMSLVDDDGNYVFDINKTDEVQTLSSIPARTLQRIYDKAAELSGLSESDVEEMERNFGTGQRNGSSSDSPATSDSPQKSSGKLSPVES